MKRILLLAGARLAAWAFGLFMADSVVPGVSVRPFAFVFAWLLFTVVQSVLSQPISRLPHGYASLALGSAGLVMTFVSLGLAASLTHHLCIRTPAAWLATGALVWLCTTIGAILLPDVYTRRAANPA